MSNYRRPDDDQPPLPKPFAFVPISNKPMQPEHPVGHDIFQNDLLTGTITGTLIARSPVHVASGSLELTGKQPSLVKAHFRCGGKPTIPGSSLKGVIRSIVEAISSPPSCVRVSRAKVKQCSDKTRLCLACRMFGAMGYLGQVHFSDAVAQQANTEIIQIPPLHPPYTRERDKVAGRKFYMHGQDGKTAPGNVPTEVCPVDATFTLRVDFENLSDGHLALLLCALGQGNPRLVPKLGGGKPLCCGSIEVAGITVTTLSASASAMNFEIESIANDLVSLASTTQYIDQNALQQLATILTYPGERACPDRNY